MKSLFPEHMQLTAKVMDLRLERQNVVASNLANLKTPGYRARSLEFEEQLQAALDRDGKGSLARTDPAHLPVPIALASHSPVVQQAVTGRVIQGLDSVDLDKEMALMAKNTMLYNALATVLQRNFSGMQDIIAKGER